MMQWAEGVYSTRWVCCMLHVAFNMGHVPEYWISTLHYPSDQEESTIAIAPFLDMSALWQYAKRRMRKLKLQNPFASACFCFCFCLFFLILLGECSIAIGGPCGLLRPYMPWCTCTVHQTAAAPTAPTSLDRDRPFEMCLNFARPFIVHLDRPSPSPHLHFACRCLNIALWAAWVKLVQPHFLFLVSRLLCWLVLVYEGGLNHFVPSHPHRITIAALPGAQEQKAHGINETTKQPDAHKKTVVYKKN